ncbi:hypothetical protein CVT24_012700 [Panaeolus cyanescens]|uniref:Uncharacterized protein n=1 Tax=Panaeolus cyanescens TaxID=181874 RepID=A0A409YK53_9AGAR|nr:hypothetical protein CVT24_012700 [Panaeolus cyanescens]
MSPIPGPSNQTSSRMIELIASGLAHTSPSSAEVYLRKIIRRVELNETGPKFSPLSISQPDGETVDYVFVSLDGSPDAKESDTQAEILESVRLALDLQPDVEIKWRAAPKNQDLSRAVWFQATDLMPAEALQTNINTHFREHNIQYQNTVIVEELNRVFYTLKYPKDVDGLLETRLTFDDQDFTPHLPHYIQPNFGLEIAVPGLQNLSNAQAKIDRYLQTTYQTSGDDPIVLRSRIELDDSVYCVILPTRDLANRFLSDPFTLLDDSGNQLQRPLYLYDFNSRSVFGSRVPVVLPTIIRLQRQVNQQSIRLQVLASQLTDLYIKQIQFLARYQRSAEVEDYSEDELATGHLLSRVQSSLTLFHSHISILQKSVQLSKSVLAGDGSI